MWSKNSCGLLIVIAEQPSESFSTVDRNGRAFAPVVEMRKAAHSLFLGSFALDGNARRTLPKHAEEIALQRVSRLLGTLP